MRLVSSSDWTEQQRAEALADPIRQVPEENAAEEELLTSVRRVTRRKPVVLIATSELQLRAFGTTVLESAGFSVRTETRGKTILANIETLQPDLILADPVLADMQAARLCSQIREQMPGKTVPILVISDQPDSPTIQRILSQDFTDFITPPVNWKVLTFRIHRWISMAKKFRTLSEQELVDLEQVRDSALKASTELLQLRNYDSVTGLPNREMFLSTVGLVLSQNQRSSGYSAVLYLDIDDFKGVNDLIGRSLGDELLRIIAKRLQGCLREGDVISQGGDEGSVTSFARLNGDQFAILLSSVQDREATAAVARRLLESVARPLTIRDRQLRLAARIGIADSSHLEGEEEVGSEEEEALVQRAETATRYCKQQKGKTYAFYESFMNELVLKKLELKAELRQAIDRDQLFLCYQLLVDSRTSAPTGVEGLIRWQHPSRGLVPPNEFLAVAEESDLIVEIDRWVLQTGCRQAKKWLDEGFAPLLMSLNVSMRFLEEEDFAKQILAIVEESGLPPSLLQLELSERGTLPDAGRIMAQFDMLVAQGVQLALDDFGTGQTSLSYLRTLPISCVKVDQSFVRRVPGDSASVAIVTAIVAMSHHLGLKVVAEGVETADHWRFLAGKDYDQLQGYLFSKPTPVAELEVMFLGNQERRRDGEDSSSRYVWTPVLPAGPGEEAEALPETPAEAAQPASNVPAETKVLGAAPAPASGTSSPIRVPKGAPGSRPAISEPAASTQPPEGSLVQLARNDFLTQLYNRFSFDERLEHAVAHADRFHHKVALLLLDLDDFKYVNDTHGHAVGDGLLVAIADRLRKLVRRVDTLARIGGDEFALVLSEFHEVRNVAEFGRRLLAVLAQPVTVEGRELRVTGSLGVSVYPAGRTQAKDLLRQADLALYKAKNRGGNGVRFFAREMDREVQQRMALARDLGGAVDRGELFVEYQLQVALATGEIVGAEALLRWDHPSRGIIDPGRFIPIAESTGEIRAIGRWVIRSACAQARHWQETCGRDVPVSVNLSPEQCRDSRFVETIVETLSEYDLAPGLLALELNEKLLQRLPQDLEDSLRQLSEHGVSLTLDNFGSGASALEHFQRFRFDRLKIHQSLVRTIGRPSAGASVLSGIVALARKMEVQIVAEGIEAREEVEGLLAEGCEIGQGFLFSKPMSAGALSDILSRSGALPGFVLPAGTEEPESPEPASDAQAEPSAPSAGPPEEIGDESPQELLSPLAPELDEILALETEPRPVSEARPRAKEEETTVAPRAKPPAVPIVSENRRPRTTPAAAAAAAPAAAAPVAPLPFAGPSMPAPVPVRPPASRWRLHAILAAAALVIWGLALWPRPASAPDPAASQSPPPVDQAAADAAVPAAEPAAAASEALAATSPSASEPVASAAPASPLVDLAQAWARAWSEQRADDFLRLYAPEFRPSDGLARDVWEAQRRIRIRAPRKIEVELSAIEAEALGPALGRVSFDQDYRSEGYSDAVRKTLELVRQDGRWLILAERTDGPSLTASPDRVPGRRATARP